MPYICLFPVSVRSTATLPTTQKVIFSSFPGQYRFHAKASCTLHLQVRVHLTPDLTLTRSCHLVHLELWQGSLCVSSKPVLMLPQSKHLVAKVGGDWAQWRLLLCSLCKSITLLLLP